MRIRDWSSVVCSSVLYVVAASGVILLLLVMFPIMGRVIAAVPTAVLGGAGLVLFGTVAASGIRTLAKVNYEDNMNLVIVAASIGFGMIPIAAPNFYAQFPSWVATKIGRASCRERV